MNNEQLLTFMDELLDDNDMDQHLKILSAMIGAIDDPDILLEKLESQNLLGAIALLAYNIVRKQ